MSKSKLLKAKRSVGKVLNYPVFIFVFILIVAFTAFFGRKHIISQETEETLKCNATGAMGGGFPNDTEAEEVFSKMEQLGLKWYQGLIADAGGIEPAVSSINIADEHDIDVIIRICYVGHCAFEDQDAGNYISALNQINNGVGGKQFYAIAGHNEPNNEAEWRDPEFEKNYMFSVINANLPSNIKLLSPIIDISPGEKKGYDYQKYLLALELSYLAQLDGLAVNVYEHDEYSVDDKINELKEWMSNNGLGGLDIFITETGPWEDQNYDSFVGNYRSMTKISNVEAALFYKPAGLYDPDRHITLEQVCEVVEPCHSQDCSSYELDPDEYDEIFGYDSAVINDCAFEDTPIPACETRGDIKMKEKLKLIYDEETSEVPPAPTTSCSNLETNNGEIISIDFGLSLCDGYAKFGATFNGGSGPLGHFMFALRNPDGSKIEGYEEGNWRVAVPGNYYEWVIDLSQDMQTRLANGEIFKGEILNDFLKKGTSACMIDGTLCGSVPPVEPPPGVDIDPTWIAKYVFTARISTLPTMIYFESCEYEGTYANEYANNLCVSKKRVSPAQIYDPVKKVTFEYDVLTKYPGYAKLINDKGVELKVEYHAGTGVLLGSMGPYDDYTQVSNGIPAHFVKDNSVTQEDLELDTTYSANYPGKKFLEDLKAWLLKLKKTPCKNDGKEYTTFTGLYTHEPTQGYESVSDYGEYVYKLPDIINKSNLVGSNCERFEEDPSKCKIATDLSACSAYVDPATGSVIPGSELDLIECLKSKDIEVWHSTGTFNDFELSGAAGILETYWKTLNNYNFSFKRICQKENAGIEIMIKGRLYDLSEDNCEFEIIDDDKECAIPPKADCSGGKGKSMKAYIPYLGSAVASLSAYEDLNQFSYFLTNDLENCSDGENYGMCYCDSGEIDPLACYLYDIGALETDLEIAMTGATREELEACP
ncbi:MAG: hypothetical protein PHS44_03710 [Candidatus Dojkabacteria bacterium]|nr:hypothetical protein [Candidatus Dojkabacteria bacterium]